MVETSIRFFTGIILVVFVSLDGNSNGRNLAFFTSVVCLSAINDLKMKMNR
jgi:hypothetical protein